MGRNRFFSSVPDSIARAGAPLPGVPLVEICNGRRVLIENHQGVVAYQRNEINIKARGGYIYVCGDDLQLIRMSRCQLVITGVISGVSFKENC